MCRIFDADGVSRHVISREKAHRFLKRNICRLFRVFGRECGELMKEYDNRDEENAAMFCGKYICLRDN